MKQLLLFLVGLLTLSFNTIGQAFDTVISKDEAIQSFFDLSAWLLGIVFTIVVAIYSASVKRHKEAEQVVSPLEDKEPVKEPVNEADNEEISAFDLTAQQETTTNDLIFPIKSPDEPLPIVEPEVEEAESISIEIQEEVMSYSPEINDDASVSVEMSTEPEISEEIASIVAEPTTQPEPKKKLVRKKKSKPSAK
jgi:hypothetical protein